MLKKLPNIAFYLNIYSAKLLENAQKLDLKNYKVCYFKEKSAP